MIDGRDTEIIRKVLETELSFVQERGIKKEAVFISLGGNSRSSTSSVPCSASGEKGAGSNFGPTNAHARRPVDPGPGDRDALHIPGLLGTVDPALARVGILVSFALFHTVPLIAPSHDVLGLAAAILSQVVLSLIIGFVASLVIVGIQWAR